MIYRKCTEQQDSVARAVVVKYETRITTRVREGETISDAARRNDVYLDTMRLRKESPIAGEWDWEMQISTANREERYLKTHTQAHAL